jgi:hypothetical protein
MGLDAFVELLDIPKNQSFVPMVFGIIQQRYGGVMGDAEIM